MTDRRTVLVNLAAGASALVGLNAIAGIQKNLPDADCDCIRPGSGPNAGWLPNVEVTSHLGQRALFYDHLLLDRRVLLHFMSVANEEIYPTSANVAEVAFLLGDRLGREIFIYSITLDPEHDTPGALAAFAERFNPPEGWLFLGGAPAAMDLIQSRLFADGGVLGAPPAHKHQHPEPSEGTPEDHQGCTFGLLRYGNESVGIWGSVPARSRADAIVARLDWIAERSLAQGTRRAGPQLGTANQSRHFPRQTRA